MKSSRGKSAVALPLKRESIALRMPPDLMEQVREFAVSNRRTVTSVIEQALEEFIKQKLTKKTK